MVLKLLLLTTILSSCVTKYGCQPPKVFGNKPLRLRDKLAIRRSYNDCRRLKNSCPKWYKRLGDNFYWLHCDVHPNDLKYTMEI